MSFIKLHHSIFTASLSPNAFRTYCGILRFMNSATSYANVSMAKLAAGACISERSAHRGVQELLSRGLVHLVKKYDRDGFRLANGYQVAPQHGRFTMLPVAAMELPLTACGFLVYCYLRKCMDSKFKAFPSLQGIARTVGITVQTMIAQMKELVQLHLVDKLHHIKRDGSYGHNQYRLKPKPIPEWSPCFPQKEKTRLDRVSLLLVTLYAFTNIVLQIIWKKLPFVNMQTVNSMWQSLFQNWVL